MRRAFAALAALALGLLAAGSGPVRTDTPDAATALRSGDYDAAIAAFTRKARAEAGGGRAHRALARLLAEVGRYGEAEETARAFASANPRSSELTNTLGETLYARGRIDEAEAAFKKSIDGRASDTLVAEVNLAVLREGRGQREEAMKGFRRLIAAYNASARLSSEELAAVGTACRHLGADEPQLFKDALKAYDEAIAADPDNMDARVRLAELFLEKYNGADAASTLKDALERNPSHPRALLALARLRDDAGTPGVRDLVTRSLKVNPHLAAAHVFQAAVLLDQEDFASAAREAEGVLAENPASLPALSMLAAARYFQGDQARFEEALRKALALDPRYADLYTTLAETCVHNRLYREAVGFAQKAVALDPRSWRALGVLGLNQLRIGAASIDDGRKSLEASFAGDPYNVWIKNTLDLLDTFPQYRETKTTHVQLFVHGKESELLSPYLGDLAEEAYAKLSERYRYRPATPIRIEVYPSHADFSVRTVGLAGLGALGACFGPVLAIDSPSAREIGHFNWGSTLWHELAHTVTMGRTDNKVPRWLGEGLSVLEERRARPGWGDDVTVEFVQALKTGKLLPIAELNNGFVRPSFPGQVELSYYQASLVLEWVEAQRGFAAVLGLLDAYRQGRATAEAFQDVLGTTLEDFDRAFFAHLEQRYAGPLGAIADFEAERKAGLSLFQQKKLDEALPHLERARALFPEYGGDDSPSWSVAMIHKERGDLRRAADELKGFTAINERHYRARVELATLLEALGDLPGAAAALDQAVYIAPFEPALHQRLAVLYARLGDRARVVGARRSLVALNPVDRPEALYQLAVALLEAGDAPAARREVLRALELAPGFPRAQELLLRLHEG
ncbi:MAG TPA: tetratricopeptide repeat protein [Vicinamibacteria bacterium]